MENTNSPVYKALYHFFRTYLTERNIEKTLGLVTDDICYVGTGAHEVALNKKELEELLIVEMDTTPRPIAFTIKNYFEKKCSEGLWYCFFILDVVIQNSESGTASYSTRFTGNIKEVNGALLLSSRHMSEASANQKENEFFPVSFVNGENMKMDREFQHSLIDTLIRTLPGGIMGVYVEVGFPVYVINEPMLDMLAYTYDEFMNATDGLMETIIHPDDLPEANRVFETCVQCEEQYEIEYRMQKSDGTYLWVHEKGRKIITEDGKEVILCVVVDISEKIRVQALLTEETLRDPLTKLYNRKACEYMISVKLKENDGFTLVLLDIDNFKKVNDIYGHHTGDIFLKYLSDLLTLHFRSSDIIVRLGGDEFMVYVDAKCNVDSITNKMKTINHSYIKKIKELAPKSNSGLSIGGIYGTGTYDFSTAYQKADKVLYHVKKNIKGKIQIVNSDDN